MKVNQHAHAHQADVHIAQNLEAHVLNQAPYICRQRHNDVLEYIVLINSHSDIMYQHMYGDKDSYEMAFMMAGKQKLFSQVPHRNRMALADMVIMEEHEVRHAINSANRKMMPHLRTRSLATQEYHRIMHVCRAHYGSSLPKA